MPTFTNKTTGKDHAIVGVAEDGIGTHGTSRTSTGAGGVSDSGVGVHGVSTAGPGVRGDAEGGVGVFGASKTSTGVGGVTDSGIGVHGISATGDGVHGVGYRGVVGESEKFQGVFGRSGDNAGVVGESDRMHAVFGICHNPNGGGIYGTNDRGGFAAVFDGRVAVNGDCTVTGDLFLPGADVAERFEVAATPQDARPGTVMVVGTDGRLTPSTRAYDRRVAGVVSGAGNYRPGLVLDKDAPDGHAVPIGLVGKVFCKVDVSNGPIEAGDLLTSADKPGHAMRATDTATSVGAVIGKALAPHVTGDGLIPVLITLR